MRILALNDDLYNYLQHVIRSHVESGLAVEELPVASALWGAMSRAVELDPSKLGKVDLEKLGADGVAMNLSPAES